MTIRPAGTWTGTGLAHEAFLFDDEASVRERCLRFVHEAVQRREPVVVVAGHPVRQLLADEFGQDPDVFPVFRAAEEAWLGGSATLAAYQAGMQPLRESGRPWRLVGEPLWLALPGGTEWSRFEAVANEAFADYPYYSLCLHDLRRLDQRHVEGQLRTHPMVWDGTQPVPNPSYVPTETYLRSQEPPWAQAPARARSCSMTSPRYALATLETLVDDSPVTHRRDEVLLAVYELVTNALKAAGAATVRHWTSGRSMVWEVSDAGPGLHRSAAGYVPPAPDLGSGRGLWLARTLADDASVRPEGPGTAVRLFFGFW